MPFREKLPSAVKHGAYSATTLLPGENPRAFEKLHRDLIAEFRPTGPLEKDIVETLARLVWRKQNLSTLRIAKLAQNRRSTIQLEKMNSNLRMAFLEDFDPAERENEDQAAEDRARQELRPIYKLAEIGEAATIDGLMKDLAVLERLDSLIDKYIKRLLFVRGLKSISAGSSDAPSGAPPIGLPRPNRAA